MKTAENAISHCSTGSNPATAEWIAKNPATVATESRGANLFSDLPDRLPSVFSALGKKVNS